MPENFEAKSDFHNIMNKFVVLHFQESRSHTDIYMICHFYWELSLILAVMSFSFLGMYVVDYGMFLSSVITD